MRGIHGRVAFGALSQAAEQVEERAWAYRPVVKRPRKRRTEAIRTGGPDFAQKVLMGSPNHRSAISNLLLLLRILRIFVWYC
jgi:hypothetical protein